MSYTASDIKILSEDELDAFPFHLIEKWSSIYHKPVEWLKRALEACYEYGYDVSIFEDKYLKGIDVPKDKNFEEFYIAYTRGRT